MKTIDEEIKINDQLNPALWDNNELKEDVKEKLLDIVDNFLDGLKEDKINIDVVDVRLLGSNANYNYTDKSDIDLHIVADFSSTPCEQNVMPQLYNAYRSLFSKAFDIKINGYDVELYVEDVNQPARSNGVYSLYTGWISEPKRSEIPEINWEQFELVFDGMEDRYFDVVGEHSDELEEEYANNIDKDILDTIKNPLEHIDGNTKCSKSAGTMLDYYFYETDKPLKLCLGAIRSIGDDSTPKYIAHVWVEVDGKIKETRKPNVQFERVLIDELALDRNKDLYTQVEEFLNKPSLQEAFTTNIKTLISKLKDYGIEASVDKELYNDYNLTIKDTNTGVTRKVKVSKTVKPTKEYCKYLKDYLGSINEELLYDEETDLPLCTSDKQDLLNSMGDTLYHCTPKKNLDSIYKNGLKDFWFSDTTDDLKDMVNSNYDYKYTGNELVILSFPKSKLDISKVDFTNCNNGEDEVWNNYGYYNGAIGITKENLLEEQDLQEDLSQEVDSDGHQLTKNQIIKENDSSSYNGVNSNHQEERNDNYDYLVDDTKLKNLHTQREVIRYLMSIIENNSELKNDFTNSYIDGLYGGSFESRKSHLLNFNDIKSKRILKRYFSDDIVETKHKKQPKDRRKPIYLYRGTSERSFSKNYDKYAGLFFSIKRKYVTGWGEVKKYLLKDTAKIYDNDDSSDDYCANKGFYDKEYPEFKKYFGMYFGNLDIKKLNQFSNLTDLQKTQLNDNVKKIAGDNFCWYDVWTWCSQLVAKIELEKQGYDGAKWTFEDFGNPIQYQIWNFDVLKSYVDEVESLQEDLELSDEYDSEGNPLTKEQVEFFKNSKIRDKRGRLLVCYHGTDSEFDTFDTNHSSESGLFGDGFYFTPRQEFAKDYGKRIIKCYLNITHPFNYYAWKDKEVFAILSKYNENFDKDEVADLLNDNRFNDDLDIIDDVISEVIEEDPYDNFSNILNELGYDGIYADDEIIAFSPNQIKSVDNKNPSNSDNINEDWLSGANKIETIRQELNQAYNDLMGNDKTRLYRYREWANNSNNDYKEYIYNDLKKNKDKSLRLWYNTYRLRSGDYDLSYDDFLRKPFKLYRATNVDEKDSVSNPFFSYALTKRLAQRFLSGVFNLDKGRTGEIEEIEVTPSQTLGMFPSDEEEIIIPNTTYETDNQSILDRVNKLIDYANKNNVELPYDQDELIDIFKKEGRDKDNLEQQVIAYVDKRKGLKEALNNFGYHAGDLGKSEGRERQTGGRGTGHFGTGTYFVGNPDKIKNYNDYQYGKGKAPHHIVDFSKYNLYKPSNEDFGFKLHRALSELNNGYKYYTKYGKDLDYFINRNLTARRSGEFECKDIPEIVSHLNNLLWDYEQIELPTDIDWNTIDDEYEKYDDIVYDELKPQYTDENGNVSYGKLFDAVEEKIEEEPIFKERARVVKEVREAIESEITENIVDNYKNSKNIIDHLFIALEGRHSKGEIGIALKEVNKHLDDKTGDSLSTIFMKDLGYDGVDTRGLSGLDNTTYGSVIYDLKPETIVEGAIDKK